MKFSQLHQIIISCNNSANMMWTRLQNIHEQKSFLNKPSLKQQLFNYRMTGTDLIAQNISKLKYLLSQALAKDDIDRIAKTLEELPHKYSSFVTSWNSSEKAVHKSSKLKIKI